MGKREMPVMGVSSWTANAQFILGLSKNHMNAP